MAEEPFRTPLQAGAQAGDACGQAAISPHVGCPLEKAAGSFCCMNLSTCLSSKQPLKKEIAALYTVVSFREGTTIVSSLKRLNIYC